MSKATTTGKAPEVDEAALVPIDPAAEARERLADLVDKQARVAEVYARMATALLQASDFCLNLDTGDYTITMPVPSEIPHGNQFFTIRCPRCGEQFTLLEGAKEIPPHHCSAQDARHDNMRN